MKFGKRILLFGVVIGAEIFLGILGMLVVSAFSRAREYRADSGGARLGGRTNMISALEALKANAQVNPREHQAEQPSLASLKISSRPGGMMRMFSTHPLFEERIERLKRAESLALERQDLERRKWRL